MFGNWQHEDNFGSSVITRILPDDLAAAVPYLSPSDLEDLQMRDSFWPALLAASDTRLGTAARALSAGLIEPTIFEPSGEQSATFLRFRTSDDEWHDGPSRRVRINPQRAVLHTAWTSRPDNVMDVAAGHPRTPRAGTGRLDRGQDDRRRAQAAADPALGPAGGLRRPASTPSAGGWAATWWSSTAGRRLIWLPLARPGRWAGHLGTDHRGVRDAAAVPVRGLRTHAALAPQYRRASRAGCATTTGTRGATGRRDAGQPVSLYAGWQDRNVAPLGASATDRYP